jgi:hypothetical protein
LADRADADGQRPSAERRKPGRMDRRMPMARWFIRADP